MADRYAALRGAIVVSAVGSLLGFALLGMMSTPAALMAGLGAAYCFYAPLMPLGDAFALRSLPRLGRSYGPVRLWGSAAFIAGSLAGGVLLDSIAARDLIWVVVAALALNVVAACALAPSGADAGHDSVEPPSAMTMWRDLRLVRVSLATALIQSSHSVYYAFSALQWAEEGLNGVGIGGLWALGVVAEIVLFAVSARFFAAPLMLLSAGAAGAVLRWSAMAFSPAPAALMPLQCLHALSFGATHLGSVAFVARAAPPGLTASAQGFLAVVLSAVTAAAMAMSGELYARFGGHAYSAMAVLAAAGGLLLAVELGRRET
jgi:PPP family 3-phenylpropionic acid transporter